MKAVYIALQEWRAGQPRRGKCAQERGVHRKAAGGPRTVAARADGAALPARAGRAQPRPRPCSTAEQGAPRLRCRSKCHAHTVMGVHTSGRYDQFLSLLAHLERCK